MRIYKKQDLIKFFLHLKKLTNEKMEKIQSLWSMEIIIIKNKINDNY